MSESLFAFVPVKCSRVRIAVLRLIFPGRRWVQFVGRIYILRVPDGEVSE